MKCFDGTKLIILRIVKTLLFLVIFFHVDGKGKNKLTKVEEEEYDFGADVFCKNRSRLIKMLKSDEVYVVDTLLEKSVLLQCKYCEEKDDGLPKIWSKQKHIFTGNITELETDMDNNATTSSVYINQQHSLIFKSIKDTDLGMYFCKAPYTDSPDKSFNYLIDISNETIDQVSGAMSDYKNYTQTFLDPVNKKLVNETYSVNKLVLNMMVFSDWSEWSECDSCFKKEGTQYRIGRCRVKPICRNPQESLPAREHHESFKFKDEQNTEKPVDVVGEVADPTVVEENILEMGIALSCRSVLLFSLIPSLYNITSGVPDFLLTERCSVSCQGRISKKGPRYKKSIILAKGAHLTLICPDSTIDSKIHWEHNNLRLRQNEGLDFIKGTIEPRIYVDSFNTLYLVEVTDEESGNYSCFVDGLHMQEVKIIVLTRSQFFTKEFTRHLRYLGFIFLICFFGYLAGVVVMCVKQKSDESDNVARKKGDSEKLLGNTTSESYDSDYS